MNLDLRKLKSICYFDGTFIMKIDDELTLFCNKEYTVASILPDIDNGKDNGMFVDADIPVSYKDLVFL